MKTPWIPRVVVNSSCIASIGFIAEGGVLEIQFQTSAVYRYFDVPTNVHHAFLSAKSKGAYFARFIKGTYRFQKVVG